MKRPLIVLLTGLVVLIGITLAGGAFAQSATDLQEKAKAAGEALKEKMAKPGDQKTAQPAPATDQKAQAPGQKEAAVHKEGPCWQILQTCKSAGFVEGRAAKGYGLYADCVNPIMQHKTVVPGATKPLPPVDPKTVADCKKRDPAFGVGPVGSRKPK